MHINKMWAINLFTIVKVCTLIKCVCLNTIRPIRRVLMKHIITDEQSARLLFFDLGQFDDEFVRIPRLSLSVIITSITGNQCLNWYPGDNYCKPQN